MAANQPNKINAEVARIIDEKGGIEKAINVLFEGLSAQKGTREVGGFKIVADGKIRLASAMAIMAYRVGMPVQRQEVHAFEYSGLREIEARLRAKLGAPELREKLAAAMENVPGGEAMVLQALEAPAVYDVDAEDVPADEKPPES
jgi:hypothetical protein